MASHSFGNFSTRTFLKCRFVYVRVQFYSIEYTVLVPARPGGGMGTLAVLSARSPCMCCGSKISGLNAYGVPLRNLTTLLLFFGRAHPIATLLALLLSAHRAYRLGC